jgi:hypothetical protein
MLTVQMHKAGVFVRVVGDGCADGGDTINGDEGIACLIPMSNDTSMNVLFTFTEDTLTPCLRHLERTIEEQHSITMGNDSALVRAFQRLDAKAFAMEVEINERFQHDVSFQERLSLEAIS